MIIRYDTPTRNKRLNRVMIDGPRVVSRMDSMVRVRCVVCYRMIHGRNAYQDQDVVWTS